MKLNGSENPKTKEKKEKKKWYSFNGLPKECAVHTVFFEVFGATVLYFGIRLYISICRFIIHHSSYVLCAVCCADVYIK